MVGTTSRNRTVLSTSTIPYCITVQYGTNIKVQYCTALDVQNGLGMLTSYQCILTSLSRSLALSRSQSKGSELGSSLLLRQKLMHQVAEERSYCCVSVDSLATGKRRRDSKRKFLHLITKYEIPFDSNKMQYSIGQTKDRPTASYMAFCFDIHSS